MSERESIVFHNQLIGLFKALLKTLPEIKHHIKEAVQYYKQVNNNNLQSYITELSDLLTPHIEAVNCYDEHIFSVEYLEYRSLTKLELIPKLDFKLVWQQLYESEAQFQSATGFRETKHSIFKYLRSIYIACRLASRETNYNKKVEQFKDEILKNLTSDMKIDPEMEKKIDELAKEGNVMGIDDLFGKLFDNEFIDDCFQKMESQLDIKCPCTKNLVKIFIKRLSDHPDFSKNPLKMFRMITNNNERKVLIEMCKQIMQEISSEVTLDDIKKEMDMALANINKKAEEASKDNPQLAELLKTAKNSTNSGDPEQLLNRLKEIIKNQNQNSDETNEEATVDETSK